jgi:2-(1,2-epoxy-1,2-dihydrophenyl)acetyl-CoA isomerase
LPRKTGSENIKPWDMTDATAALTPTEHLLSIDTGVATVTLDRPAAYNALTADLLESLLATFVALRAEPDVRAIVFTGAGKGFCSGQALNDRRSLPDENADISVAVVERYNPLLETLITFEKPIVAAINGVVAGAGLGLALACDFRIVADDAVFTTAFVKIGLACDAGTTLLLPRIVGYANALELCLTGERFDARRANALGLVTRLVAAGSAGAEADAFARRLAEGPASLALVKRELVRNGLGDVRAALAFEAELQSLAGKTADFREGLAAFTAKRPPAFRGR